MNSARFIPEKLFHNFLQRIMTILARLMSYLASLRAESEDVPLMNYLYCKSGNHSNEN